ncbi:MULTISPECIES: alpha-(1-_3)-arabinofuranosyltransferase domain-containing protein [unclassified Blastococcus]
MASTPLDELTGPPAAGPAAPAEPAPSGPGRVHRLLGAARAALVCAGFVVLAVLQRPGEVVGDTKLDLVVDPLGFLGRALTLWDPEGAAGQLQNQAYGYFFPMGPFFALGQVLGVPPWLVQRLWLALLMSVACLGVAALARRLGIGTPTTALAAGVAYALAPRMLTSMGAVSAELVPMALAPWVLVPLAGVAVHGSARRAAMRSGLAVACIGGVNAVATAAALPLAALYLLTRPPGPLRRRLIGWWVLAVALATAWWAVPLLLFGRYSPRFLDYIETAAVTTAPTDVLTVLRGTSHWIAHLETLDGPVWPAGWSLVHDATPAAATVVLAAAGLAALCRSDLRERRWLVLGVLTGVVLVSMGHLAEVDGWAAGWLREALDGPLAPLRNVHKFDPVLRLPLALGLAHLSAVLVRRAGRGSAAGRSRARTWAGRAVRLTARAVVAAAVALTVVAAATPALAGRLLPASGFEDVPGYWRETAEFLAAEQPSGRALLVPGSAFATYAWGSATDEPLQPLARSPWDVRNQIPLTPEGHIRMLDAVEARLSRGEGSPGLGPFLARAGISHLVLRNDLDPGEAGVTRAILVRQALAASPGITPVAGFGPVLDPPAPRDGRLVDAGLTEPAPAVQVYAVADAAPPAWTAPLSSAVGVRGGPDAVLPLEDRGLVTGRPTVTAGDDGTSGVPVVVSDALVRRERNVGRVSGATSAGLSRDDPRRLDTPVRDYPLPDMAGAESVVAYLGGRVDASSSASDAAGFQAGRLDTHPWAALDGDPLTAWQPAPWADISAPSWWRLTTDSPFAAPGVTVTLGARLGFQRPTRLVLTTDAGAVTVPVADTGEPQLLPLPAGETTSLTISSVVVDGDASDGYGLVLAEVGVPGVALQRTVVAPRVEGPVDVYAFDVSGGRTGCVVDTAGVPRCAAALVDAAEERLVLDRTFDTAGAADHDLAATALPRLGPDLDALLAQVRGGPAAEASSSTVWDPRGSPAAAVDGDPRTTWLAGGDDQRPLLTLTFPEVRTIDSLRVVTDPTAPASAATAVTVYEGDGPRTVPLDGDGWARFAPVETDRLSITLEQADVRETVDPPTGRRSRLGIGVSELEVGGPNPAAAPGTPVAFPCGSGPDVQVDGGVLQTAATTTLGALTAVRPIPLEVCAGGAQVALAEGEHRLQARAGGLLAPASVTLTRAGSPGATAQRGRTPVERSRWDAEHRTVEVGARSEPTLLVVPENANPGWTARLDGGELESVTVDGWQQGYVLPEGPAATVRLDFAPASAYRLALVGGAGAVLLLALVCVLPARPPRGPAGARRRSTVAALGATAVLVASVTLGMGLAGGAVGVGALAVLWLVGWCAGRWRGAVLGTLAAGALLAAGLVLLDVVDGTGTERQQLAIAALAAAAAAVLPGRGAARLRRRSAAEPEAAG